MKKIILILTLIFSAHWACAQITRPDTTKKEFKNIVGIDATGLLQQFFNFNTNAYYNYPYIITYRRIFKSNAFRFGFGGNFSKNNTTTNDTLHNESSSNNFNIGLGFEHYSWLGKRWNVYFGADFLFTTYQSTYKYTYTSTSNVIQSETSNNYGVAPLLGLVFKINARLSIATEASYYVSYNMSDSKKTYTPSSSYDQKSHGSGIQTQFYAPTAVNVRIAF